MEITSYNVHVSAPPSLRVPDFLTTPVYSLHRGADHLMTSELFLNSAAFNPEEKNRRVIPHGGTTVRQLFTPWATICRRDAPMPVCGKVSPQ
jgi:hypothetical protein